MHAWKRGASVRQEQQEHAASRLSIDPPLYSSWVVGPLGCVATEYLQSRRTCSRDGIDELVTVGRPCRHGQEGR